MSKCTAMHAGSSGSSYGCNKMSKGNCNGKWQGLASTKNRSAKMIKNIQSRSYGKDRNVVFKINQLGGVGGKTKMFAANSDGLNAAQSSDNNSK